MWTSASSAEIGRVFFGGRDIRAIECAREKRSAGVDNCSYYAVGHRGVPTPVRRASSAGDVWDIFRIVLCKKQLARVDARLPLYWWWERGGRGWWRRGARWAGRSAPLIALPFG